MKLPIIENSRMNIEQGNNDPSELTGGPVFERIGFKSLVKRLRHV